MSIEVTDEAAEILRRSLELGRIDPATGGVRLRRARTLGGGSDVQVELAEGPAPDDEVVELEGLRVFVDPSVTEALPHAIVGVEPEHDRIAVRAP